VANSSPPFDGFIDDVCFDEEELEEEQIDFTFSEEDNEGSSPSSPAPVAPEPPASPKGATFNPSNTVKAGNPPSSPPISGKWRDLFSPTETSHLARSSCIFQP
jgi:hypothetical protein